MASREQLDQVVFLKEDGVSLNIITLGILGLSTFVSGTGSAFADACTITRGFSGVETVMTRNPSTYWNLNAEAYRNNQAFNGYVSMVGRCDVTSSLVLKAEGGAEYSMKSRAPGSFEGSQNQGIAILNDLYGSWTLSNNLFVDFGKIRRSSSNMFSAAPLDLLRNPTGNMRSQRLNALGNSWRSFYSEGALGVSSVLYRNSGTFELAAFPKLVKQPALNTTISDWTMLQRTNSQERYYAAYTSTGLDKFNPTIALLGGNKTQAISAGTSGFITESTQFTLESSVARGERWNHINSETAAAAQRYQNVNPFGRQVVRPNIDFGAGLRYTNANQTEYGVEYYAQSQGYSRKEWNTLFDTAHFVNVGYAKGIPGPWMTPQIRDAYRKAAEGMASEIDNINRMNYLQGKNYITAYISTNKNQLRHIDWVLSDTLSLADGSSAVNLHLKTNVTDRIAVYGGASTTIGSQRSEFGMFGERITVYTGVKINW